MKTLVAGFALLVITIGCGPTLGNTPQEMFQNYLHKIIPEGVSNIEGIGDGWQGASIYLKFNATDSALKELLVNAKKAKWNEMNEHFEIPFTWDWGEFKDGWNPEDIEAPICYIEEFFPKEGVRRVKYFAIDRKKNEVYVYIFET